MASWEAGLLISLVFFTSSTVPERRERISASKTMSYRFQPLSIYMCMHMCRHKWIVVSGVWNWIRITMTRSFATREQSRALVCSSSAPLKFGELASSSSLVSIWELEIGVSTTVLDKSLCTGRAYPHELLELGSFTKQAKTYAREKLCSSSAAILNEPSLELLTNSSCGTPWTDYARLGFESNPINRLWTWVYLCSGLKF